MQSLKHIYWVLVVWTVCSTSAWAANDKTFFWQVQSEQTTIYLYGSIHLATPDIYPLRESIESTFQEVDNLVVEIDIGALDPAATQQWMMAHAMYPPGESIRNHINEATWKKLEQYAQKNEIPLSMLQRQKPGLLVTSLATIQMMKMGLQPEMGLDQHFLQQARGNKPILELETFEEQMNALLSMSDGNLVIEQSLSQMTMIETYMEQLLSAWREGDDERLNKLMVVDTLEEYPEFKPVIDQLFTLRNQRMAEKILGYLQTDQTYFVVVGAGHLVGEDSVVELLKTAGFAAKRL